MQYLKLRVKNPFYSKRVYTRYWYEKEAKLGRYKRFRLGLTKFDFSEIIDFDLLVDPSKAPDSFFGMTVDFKLFGVGLSFHLFDTRSKEDFEYANSDFV